ncbi:methyltransferase domain-containing protein [Candidatus Dojkabacteria bacterium]|uniref:Methyltransferase domain-containing protein n=1 Tax=Candidatus Dojkabacteria bacterium TaxID=2099670 RepID=A0A955HYN4_9BACT|nr:methyltransferase domain-containing protein [Candidatus Dojkabacteria bacterium]
MAISEFGEEYNQYLSNRSFLRNRMRRMFYFRDLLQYIIGDAIDFGCGVGELLEYLRPGSIGFEVNPDSVAQCRSKNLKVFLYEPEKDQYKFSMIQPGKYKTFTMNHVLEHIPNAAKVLAQILSSCARLEIDNVQITVPGYKGFEHDKTHIQFIDDSFLEKNGFTRNKKYKIVESKYYPINNKSFSKYFTHNEFRIIMKKI